MSGNECSDGAGDERLEDAVDPRVQIELERLNTATDDINKLEVDLDEARATFRKLLCESTITINTMAKKLGSCIEKSKPYYDSRFKAKEALREAQKAAVRFERANGQHAAAKEMVYLAEEGLRMEGRSFDHAWQEMLNHATERVNESEHERAISEAEHRHMTAIYHNAEHNVQRLQSELKRSITKSSMDARRSLLLINSIAYRHSLLLLPYYEMKAQFNHLLEKQKTRVSVLERSVTDAKTTYAEALRNLEKISDEIHRTRGGPPTPSPPHPPSSDSSPTGSPDSTDYASDEYLQLPSKMSPTTPCPVPKSLLGPSSPDYPPLPPLNMTSSEPRKYITRDRPKSHSSKSPDSPNSDENRPKPTKNPQKPKKNSLEKETTPPKIIPNSSEATNSLEPIKKIPNTGEKTLSAQCQSKPEEKSLNLGENWSKKERNSPDTGKSVLKIGKKSPDMENSGRLCRNGEEWTEISLNNSPDEIYYNNDVYSDEEDSIPYKPLPSELSPDSGTASGHNEPITKKRLVNQQSLPGDWASEEGRGRGLSSWISRNSAVNCGEGSASSSRRQSLDVLWGAGPGERVKELLNHGMMILNISSLTERRGSEPREGERGRGKKVPSPLERTMGYLQDEETSDSESLASVEMLSEDQISSLMMEPDMNQVCQEVLGTPLVEVCPLLQELQQQH